MGSPPPEAVAHRPQPAAQRSNTTAINGQGCLFVHLSRPLLATRFIKPATELLQLFDASIFSGTPTVETLESICPGCRPKHKPKWERAWERDQNSNLSLPVAVESHPSRFLIVTSCPLVSKIQTHPAISMLGAYQHQQILPSSAKSRGMLLLVSVSRDTRSPADLVHAG